MQPYPTSLRLGPGTRDDGGMMILAFGAVEIVSQVTLLQAFTYYYCTTTTFTALRICCRLLLPCVFAALVYSAYISTSMMAGSNAASSNACQVYPECKKDHAKTCISLMHLNLTTTIVQQDSCYQFVP